MRGRRMLGDTCAVLPGSHRVDDPRARPPHVPG
jgi:hypothetical protein